MELFQESIAIDISGAIIGSITTLLLGEVLCYFTSGRQFKDMSGESGLTPYLHTRHMAIWIWIAFCATIDIFLGLIGWLSMVQIGCELLIFGLYPSVMNEVVAIIWHLDEE